MRAWLLVAVLMAAPSDIGASQDARPFDPALVQRFIDGDSATRKQIAASLSSDAGAPFRVAVLGAGTELARQGRSKEAIHAMEAGLEAALIFNAPRSEISALINLGMVYGQTGEYTVAMRYLTGALEKTEPGRDDDLIAAAANNLGNIYRRRGEYDKALEMQQRVLESNLAAKREAPAARTLNNIGMIYQAQGNFQQAIEYYIRSLELKERLGSQDDVSTTLGNIGAIYHLQGNDSQSVEYFERALAIAEKTNNVRLTIGALGDVGRMLIAAGRLDAAAARLTRARTLAEQAGYSEQLANILSALGGVETERRRWPQAIELLTRARALATEVGDPAEIGQAQLGLARIELERGDAAAATTLAREARDTLAAIGRSTSLLDAEVLYGEALTSMRQWNEAVATFERAIDLTERGLDLVAGGADARYRYLQATANAYVGLIHAYAAAGRAAEALMAAERGRARTLLDLLSASHAGEDELSESERERRKEIDASLSALNDRMAAERQRAGKAARPDPALAAEMDRLRRSRDEFYLGLDAKHPRLRFARGEAPVLNARELARQLPAKTALIEFAIGPRGAWVLLLTPQAGREPRVIARPAAMSADKLNTLAAEFTRQVATRDLAFSPNARALYDALIGPIDAELSTIDGLIVVPHGALWEVPFQALQTPRRTYLIEEHAISYAPSASALKALESHRRPRSSQPRVVAFGDPRVSDANAAPLPNAAKEAREVAAVYGGNAVAVTDADASEDRFRQLAPRADIVHVATHGVLDNTSPLFSYLMLSGSGQGRAADGRLEGRELINMKLDAELIVLSACDTARGRIANGEGVIGLSWALFAAGASTTTVSLWPVDSASTTELMSAFHRERKRLTAAATTAPTAQALRAAQLLALARPESRHPFYWAGFVVIGAP